MDVPIRRRRDDDSRPELEFEQLRRSFADQLEQWPDFLRALPSVPADVVPLADVEETDDSYLLDVELPGVARGDVDLRVDHRRVVVTGARRERRRLGLLRHGSRTSGRFALSVTLPGPVDPDAVTATLDHGVLSIVVPKAQPARRRRIPVDRKP